MYTYTIVHRRTREVLHSVILPATRDVRKGKSDVINAWRTTNRDYSTPVAVIVTTNN